MSVCIGKALLLVLGLLVGRVFSFSVDFRAADRVKTIGFRDVSLKVTFSSASHGSKPDDERRKMEFMDLGPAPQNERRRERIEREMENKANFVSFGDELWGLREQMDRLSSRLLKAAREGEEVIEEHTRDKLRDFEQRDPELVYMLEVADMEDAVREGRMEEAESHRQKALAARSCLPHFNLEGLWVGKYGNHGYELINVTYAGDTLIATKITGDKNVPRNEITFQVDLHPLKQRNPFHPKSDSLQPIILTDKAAKKWGTKKLPRYSGLGQVAEEGFKNNQWMNGQLIIIGSEYFSFAWIPIEQQIFFGRPSPELALKMLREGGDAHMRYTYNEDAPPPSINDNIDRQKSYAMKCLEVTHEFEDLFESNPMGCVWHSMDTDQCYFE